jgi:hypothetical protein
MPRRRSGKLWRGLLILCVLLAHPAVAQTQESPATPIAADADATLARWRDEAMTGRAAFGPADGTLLHQEDAVAIAPAGVRLRNFYAVVRFHNPYDASSRPWDYGFRFRLGRSDEYRAFVSSTGQWQLNLGVTLILQSGPIDGLDVTDGGANLLEIAVSGGEAMMSVNAGPAVTLDVSRSDLTGDIEVGTGFVIDQLQPGAATAYEGFAVWPLSGPEREPSPGASALIDQGRQLRDAGSPLSGPTAGALVLGSGTDNWIRAAGAGVNIRDGYARVTIRAPEGGNDHPWDVGLTLRDVGVNEQWRLFLASDGSWYVLFGLGALVMAGELRGFHADPGTPIDFEVALFGDRAAFAVNGEPVAEFDVSTGTEAGNVRVASPFYFDDAIPYSVLVYEDFAVWSDEPGGAIAVPPQSDFVPETEEDATIFAGLLKLAQARAERYGPEKGQIGLDSGGTWYVGGTLEAQNFAAQAQFFNPFDAAEHPWDYGFAFRMRAEGDPPAFSYYVLVVSSDLRWYLYEAHPDGQGTLIQDGTTPGFDLSPFGDNLITIAAVGDDAYFAINGAFVGKLDVSSLKQAGRTVAVAGLLPGDDIAGGWMAYDYFEVWSLDGSSNTGDIRVTSQALGGSYTSPTYGYSIRWDDTWSVVEESSADGTDTLELTTGLSNVNLTGYQTSVTALSCVDEQADVFRQMPDVTNVELQPGSNGQPIRSGDATFASALYAITVTVTGQEPIPYRALVECQPIELGKSMLRFVHLFPEADSDAEVDARNALLATLTFGAAPDGAATPEATGPVVAELAEQGGSGVGGLVTLVAAGSQTTVTVVALGAGAGVHVALHRGSCGQFDAAPEFTLNDLDDTGRSETTIDAELTALRSTGYAIVLTSAEGGAPLACGEIGAGE